MFKLKAFLMATPISSISSAVNMEMLGSGDFSPDPLNLQL
jgi:hypothetical protein